MATPFSDHVILSSRDRIKNQTINSFGDTPILGSPSYCTLELQSPIQNFQRIELINFSIANTFYSFSDFADESVIINNLDVGIPLGVYDLNSFLEAYVKNANVMTTFGLNMVFNRTLSRIIITFDTPTSISFLGSPITAQIFGADPVDYGIVSNLILPYPPALPPLDLFINIDVLGQPNSLSIGKIIPNFFGPIDNAPALLTSCTWAVIDTTNKLEYINFYQNTNYSSRLYSNQAIANTLVVKIIDKYGSPILNCSDWVMVLRFVRTPYEDPIFNSIPATFNSPNISL